MSAKIKVIHFQRKPRPGFNYSIESIFENLRCSLKDKIDFGIKNCGWYNNGYFSKLLNIIQATFRQRKNAISHITGEVHFLDIFMRKKNVLLTIHDCRFMLRKKGLAKKLMQYMYLKWPVAKSAYVVAISEQTKKDILKYTNCSPEKIKVIYNSIDPVFQPSFKVFNKTKPVILQVGAGPNKNIMHLIEALREINCRLIIIGSPDAEVITKLNSYKIDVLIKYNLSKRELYKAYIDCDIVAFVSVFEGFGMPVIEANCVGRAVITSKVSSMPEVAGNAACLADPYNAEAIKKGIIKIIEDDAYREELIENGKINSRRFNANKIAEDYYSIYKKIALSGNLIYGE